MIHCFHNIVYNGWFNTLKIRDGLQDHGFRARQDWKLFPSLLKNILWFEVYRSWNAVLNSGHWLGSALNCDTTTIPLTFPLGQVINMCFFSQYLTKTIVFLNVRCLNLTKHRTQDSSFMFCTIHSHLLSGISADLILSGPGKPLPLNIFQAAVIFLPKHIW